MNKAKFELQAKNAALQEKVVGLQKDLSDSKEETRQRESEVDEREREMVAKMNELEKNLQKEQKAKSLHREKFLEDLKQCIRKKEILDRVSTLDNTITELEEEKGNLQLRLVDYDELAASETKARQEIRELSDRYGH